MEGGATSNLAFIYDLRTPEAGWVEVQSMSEGRDYIDCMQVGNDIIVPGGYQESVKTSTVVVYDILADLWRQTTSLPEARAAYHLVRYTESNLYMVGGTDDDDEYPTEIFEYNSQGNSWTVADITMNPPSSAPVAEVLPEDSIHLPSC